MLCAEHSSAIDARLGQAADATTETVVALRSRAARTIR
jgi:hypothetical protein